MFEWNDLAGGVVSDALIHQQSTSSIKSVFAPKLDGVMKLAQAAHNMSLQIFHSFSSVAALVGSRGQANYAAANAALDHYMAERATTGISGRACWL